MWGLSRAGLHSNRRIRHPADPLRAAQDIGAFLSVEGAAERVAAEVDPRLQRQRRTSPAR
jgi:hypothetical protein